LLGYNPKKCVQKKGESKTGKTYILNSILFLTKIMKTFILALFRGISHIYPMVKDIFEKFIRIFSHLFPNSNVEKGTTFRVPKSFVVKN
jgi:hypothetical protein